MSQSAHTPRPEDGSERTRELAFVGADRAAGSETDADAPRRLPLPTLHLAAHEIIHFAPPHEPETGLD